MWTNKIPTIPGWYWIKNLKHQEKAKMEYVDSYKIGFFNSIKENPIETRNKTVDYWKSMMHQNDDLKSNTFFQQRIDDTLSHPAENYQYFFQGPIAPAEEYEEIH